MQCHGLRRHRIPRTPRIAAAFAAVPDAFQRLWTPHRIAYIQSDAQQPASDGCPFCVAPTLTDEEALIVHRGEHAYVLLNLFPYNSGHLLVCPYRHVATLRRGDARRRSPRSAAHPDGDARADRDVAARTASTSA